METRRGRVVELVEGGAIIEMDDGARRFIEIPPEASIEVGTSVLVAESIHTMTAVRDEQLPPDSAS